MKTEIIAAGAELLRPGFLDTNSVYLNQRLYELGISVSFRTVVGDDEKDLWEAAKTALRRSRLILAVGGLGPTEDDRTREVFAAVLGRKLVFRKKILDEIRARFEKRSLSMPAVNRKQAFAIEGSEILNNSIGTAPGVWLDDGRRRIALLPGPPRELRPMFEDHVRPRLEALGSGVLLRRTIRMTGIGESHMETLIRDVYKSLPAEIEITTLSSPGDLAIHLTCPSDASTDQAEQRLDRIQAELLQRLGPYVYSTSGESLEEIVAACLISAGKTLACAESCSGGLLSHRLTNVPGSSGFLMDSVVAYSNRSKTQRLGVPPALLEKHGAVSASAARAMAEGVRESSGADCGVSITGIAGPGGGTAKKPVGLVYIGLSHDGGTLVKRNLFLGGRERIKFQSSQKALDLLRIQLTKKKKKS